MDAIAVIESVRKVYTDWRRRTVVAVDDLSLTLERGTVHGFVGPNGAGKSSTIRMLLGLASPSEGSVRLNAATVGYLPEVFRPLAGTSARGYLVHVARLDGASVRAARELSARMLERVGIADAGDRGVSKLSKGMRQRLGLAQALMARPEFAVLDEPMSGLDPSGRAMARELISEARVEGTTILMCTHALEDVSRLCDHVTIFSSGKSPTGTLSVTDGMPLARLEAEYERAQS